MIARAVQPPPRDGVGFVSPYRARLAQSAAEERDHPSIYERGVPLTPPSDSSLTWNPAQDRYAALISAITAAQDHRPANFTYPTSHRPPSSGLVGSLLSVPAGVIRDAITAAVAPSVGEVPHDPRLSKGGNSSGLTMQAMRTPYDTLHGGVTGGDRAWAAGSLLTQLLAPEAVRLGARGAGTVARALDAALAPDVMEGVPVSIQRTTPSPVARVMADDAAWRQRFLAPSPPPTREALPWPAPTRFAP